MVLASELEALRNDGLTLSQIAWNLQFTRWMNGAAISLLIYDTFLILGDEVELLWPRRWTVIKAFYFLNRALCAVFTLVNAQQFITMRAVSDEFCLFILFGVGSATFISFAMCNWMLLARTRAFVGLKRPYLDTALVVYFAISYLITGVLAIITCIQIRDKIFYSPTIRICAASVHPKTMGLIWICPMLFEATIFIMTTYSIYRRTRSNGAHFGSRLFSILFRDGVCYYVSICLFRIWNLVVWNLRPISLAFTGIFILWSTMSIACSRLQLNLLKATTADTRTPTGITSAVTGREVTTFGHRVDGNRRGYLKSTSTFYSAKREWSRHETFPLSTIQSLSAHSDPPQ